MFVLLVAFLCNVYLSSIGYLLLKITFCYFVRFGENMMRDQGQLDIFPASVIPKSIQHMMKPIWMEKDGRVGWSRRSKFVAADDSNMGLRVVTEPAVLSSVLKYVADSEVYLDSVLLFSY